MLRTKPSISTTICFRLMKAQTIRASNHKTDECYGNVSFRTIHQQTSSILSRFEFPWKHGRVVPSYWKHKRNQRKFVDWLGTELGIKSTEDWYNVTGLDFKKKGGVSLLSEFNGSIFSCLQSVYPEIQFLPWRFRSSTKGFWREMKNQRDFFDWLGNQLGLTSWEDWYKVSSSTVHQFGGGGMITPFYGNCMSYALRTVYPEHDWILWKFGRAPKKFWSHRENQMEYVKWIEGVLNIQQKDDWYRVKLTDITGNHGHFLMQLYNGSMYKFLQTIYPEHNWIPWKLCKNPRDVWNNTVLVRQYIDELAQQLHVSTLDDWYRISGDQLYKKGAAGLITKYGGLPPLLMACFPEHDWQVSKFWNKTKKSTQRWLRVCMGQLLPEYEIYEDFRHPDMKFQTQENMELDVYIPSLKLALEYHGEQHYRDIFSFSPQRKYEGRDIQKVEVCKERGITLIVVPYWWDRQLPSLAASIKSVRPDLPLPLEAGSPIPSAPSKKMKE